jgi:L-fucose isomerase-like protein
MNSIDPDELRRYHEELHKEAERLDRALAELRADEDAGRLAPRPGADARIAVLEAHLRRLRLLREEYLNDH